MKDNHPDLDMCLALSFIDNTSFLKGDESLFDQSNQDFDDALIYAGRNISTYASGYKDAANLIIDAVQCGYYKSFPDILAYPVLFLYRHYLELLLKDLISQEGKKYEKIHTLEKLWSEFYKSILLKSESKKTLEQLERIDKVIRELSAIDPLSMTFRYAENKNGELHMKEIKYINLNNVKSIINKISNFLECYKDME